MSKHTEAKVREYITRNLTHNTYNTIIKLLSIEEESYKRIVDLLVDYRISLQDFENLKDLSKTSINEFITTYESELLPYSMANNIAPVGINYLMNQLGLRTIAEQGVIASSNLKKKDLYSFIPRISISEVDRAINYRNMQSFMIVFLERILPALLIKLGCTSSIKELFPTSPQDITAKFANVRGSLWSPNGQVPAKELAESIYRQIFGNLFSSFDYLSTEGLPFLLYRINSRMSKLETECAVFQDVLSLCVPDGTALWYINSLAVRVESNGGSFSIVQANEILWEAASMNYRRKLNEALVILHTADAVRRAISLEEPGLRDVLESIKSTINEFQTMMIFNFELAGKHLLIL